MRSKAAVSIFSLISFCLTAHLAIADQTPEPLSLNQPYRTHARRTSSAQLPSHHAQLSRLPDEQVGLSKYRRATQHPE